MEEVSLPLNGKDEVIVLSRKGERDSLLSPLNNRGMERYLSLLAKA